VYRVFATLIEPSLGTRQQPPARRLPLAYAIGIVGYAAGLALSAALDLPSGALIVWCLALLAMAVHAAAPVVSATAKAEALSDGSHAAV
jgi:zinc/manganese transport system permease protein